jgi:predicted nucleic acid-binding protein
MRILVDTNILLRAAQPSHPMHASAVRAMEILMEREEPLVVTVQNIAEFWNAATRPSANNGLGFTIEEAQEELSRIEVFFEIISENMDSYAAWKTLKPRMMKASQLWRVSIGPNVPPWKACQGG